MAQFTLHHMNEEGTSDVGILMTNRDDAEMMVQSQALTTLKP
jgi:hypothetical protein